MWYLWFAETMIYASVSFVRKCVCQYLEVGALESDILGSNSCLDINYVILGKLNCFA